MTFARNLFDAPFEYDEKDDSRQDLVRATRQERRSVPTWRIADDELARFGDPSTDPREIAAAGSDDDAAEALHNEELTTELKALLAGGPSEVSHIQEELWPADPDGAGKLEALVALGSRICDAAGNPILSARYHMFVRATEGAFVSFSDDGVVVRLGRHNVDPETGRAVFEFGTCQRCGTVHLAGDVKRIDRHQYFQPSSQGDRAVKWLVVTDEDTSESIDEDEETLATDSSKADPKARLLCSGCGLLTDEGAMLCSYDACPGGPLIRVREHASATTVMSTCTACGARARQVIRRLRTDTNAAPAVITTALYQQLPVATDDTVEEVGDGRKLLMFSDSRQAAAFAAPYLDRTYTRVLERRYLTLALQDPKYAGDEFTVEDLAILARRKATNAGHFHENEGSIAREKRTSEWVAGELMTLERNQSLEGLGLMKVSLARPRKSSLPRAFAALGLTDEEAWDLLDELAKLARQQGAMIVPDGVDVKSERFEPRNIRVRMRSIGSDSTKQIISWLPSGRSGTTNNRVRFVQKVLDALGQGGDAANVLQGCWKYLEQSGFIVPVPDKFAGDVSQIEHGKLRVHSGRDTSWFRCDKCRRITAFNVRGVCPNSTCAGSLEPYALPSAGDETNHYRTIYQTMNPAPLSAKEHTAQWDAQEAAEIQRNFIEGRVNVLSCTTTFELGVDVGDLQSVVMRNMPPKTANYVQRAGRAGRRAASAALVLTYANRNSHDLAKFQYPESMIIGTMRIPWVPIDNERIGRRHAHSVALAAYFRHCALNEGKTWRQAGEFFARTDDGQDSPATRVVDFLTPVPPQIKQALVQILPDSVQKEIDVESGGWVVVLTGLLDKAQRDIRSDVDTFTEMIEQAKRDNKLREGDRLQRTLRTIEGRQLLGYLANKNILPKYGFPVDTVELRTFHSAEPIGSKLELSRDLGLAIYEYAPGNQVVAGGKIWTSRGLHKLPGRELDEMKYRVCSHCDRFESGRELDAAAVCRTCNEPFRAARTFVIPEFGFMVDRQTADVGTAPPERRWHGSSYVEDIGDEIDTFRWSSTGGIEVAARAGTRATLAVISEGDGAGFHVCGWCGWGEPVAHGKRRKAHERPQSGQSCTGPLKAVSLGHRYQTDVAEFTFGQTFYDKDSEGRWLSVLYALLEGASEALEISRDDIDGTLSWSGDGRRSIVLFDTVPAGAGASRKIAENLDKVLGFAVDRVTMCDCGEETSCYGCLRSYRNARHHDQLSRRGALTILNDLRVQGSRSSISHAWGVSLELASPSAQGLLQSLADRGLPEPEIGIEVGKSFWPIEAIWREAGVVLVEGSDSERDSELSGEGLVVFDTDTVVLEQMAEALA